MVTAKHLIVCNINKRIVKVVMELCFSKGDNLSVRQCLIEDHFLIILGVLSSKYFVVVRGIGSLNDGAL